VNRLDERVRHLGKVSLNNNDTHFAQIGNTFHKVLCKSDSGLIIH
jgi:hypothetical protein